MGILISVNGVMGPAAQTGLPATDRGFLFGDAVFESLVAFGNKLIDPHKHLERLRYSAETFDIPIPWSDAELLFELESLCESLGSAKTYLRLCVTRGSGLGLTPSPDLKPNRIVHAATAPVPAQPLRREGLRLQKKPSPSYARGAQPKTPYYLPAINAHRQGASEGWDDVLWVNSEGEVCECASANIFFIGREGDMLEVVTPALSCGVLAGITRQRMIDLMRQTRVLVTERAVTADELARFDEAFVTSSVRGLMPVRAIDQQRFHTRRPQATFQHLERLHQAWLTAEIGKKLDWDTGLPVNP